MDTVPLVLQVRALESKLDAEKLARQRSESQSQEKGRKLFMLTVDNRQLQYSLDKIEADYRQESEKVRGRHHAGWIF